MRKLTIVFGLSLISLASSVQAQFCPGVSPWVFDDVLASDSFCPNITWMALNNITLGCATLGPFDRLYCPDANVTRKQMAAFMFRLGTIRVEEVDTGPGLTGGPITLAGTIGLATTQLLPTTACTSGQVPKWSGSNWTCATVAGGGGTVTSVVGGTGVVASPSPITTSGTLNLALSYQLPQGCSNGQVAKSNGSGGWTCAADNNGGGTVTSVATGTGLTGGPITASGTIGLAGTQLLPTVACATNQVPQWNGSAWICGSASGGSLGGSGTAGFLPIWTGATTLANSLVHQASGNVGVSVTGSLLNQLQVGDTPGFSSNQLALGNGAQAMSFALTPSASIWYNNTNFSLQSTVGDALVGIGGIPTHNLDVFGGNAQIGLVNTSNSTSATISKYTNRMEVSPIDAFQISVGGLAHPHFWIGGNGFVGVGTTSPASSLQVGSVGSTGYSGHDIAFGNGVQASGIAQTASVAQWYSTTDIALMPHGNGHGRVGINTAAPAFPLDVSDFVAVGPADYNYFSHTDTSIHNCPSCIANITIHTNGQIMAGEFDAFSDVRIKDVIGTSDSARDLATINALQVTDYTLKDKAKNGNKPFKKVIAQQVEKVYPQVVSQHPDFIPNVYRTASAVTKIAAGTLLHFENAHGLSPGAKRLKLLTSGENTMQQVGIVSIPSGRDVVTDALQLKGDKVFVYGEEVSDFRTIDYEGLATLNISATQEIAKRLAKQQADLAALVADKDAQVAELREQLAKQQARVAELESLAADMSELRAQLAALKRNATAPQWHDAALRP
jgi:Chaperone of endosialidase